MQKQYLSNDEKEYIFISVGCNSKIKIIYWYKIFKERTGSIINDLESGCKTERRSVSSIESTTKSISEMIKNADESENISQHKFMNQEYYSSASKIQNKLSTKTSIPIKSEGRSSEIEIKLNMKTNMKPEKKTRCFSTNAISSRPSKDQFNIKGDYSCCNIVEIKVTTLEPTSCSASKVPKLSNAMKYFDRIKQKSPFETKSKYRLGKKFESLKKLSQKTKACGSDINSEYLVKSCEGSLSDVCNKQFDFGKEIKISKNDTEKKDCHKKQPSVRIKVELFCDDKE